MTTTRLDAAPDSPWIPDEFNVDDPYLEEERVHATLLAPLHTPFGVFASGMSVAVIGQAGKHHRIVLLAVAGETRIEARVAVKQLDIGYQDPRTHPCPNCERETFTFMRRGFCIVCVKFGHRWAVN